MEIGTFYIEVMFTLTEKEEGGERVDDNADTSNDRDDHPLCRDWMIESLYCFPADHTDSDEENQGIHERCQNRTLLIPIGVFVRSFSPTDDDRKKRESENRDIAQIVSCVGHE